MVSWCYDFLRCTFSFGPGVQTFLPSIMLGDISNGRFISGTSLRLFALVVVSHGVVLVSFFVSCTKHMGATWCGPVCV